MENNQQKPIIPKGPSKQREEPLKIVYLPEDETHFSDETLQALRELGAVLEPIYRRLTAEGYVIKNGKIIKEPTIQA